MWLRRVIRVMLCIEPPPNANNDECEGNASVPDEEETGFDGEVAHLTIHEDDIEFFLPIAYSVCYPVWQAACIFNVPFYPFPMVCPIKEAKVFFKNMMFEAEELPNHIISQDGNDFALMVEKLLLN